MHLWRRICCSPAFLTTLFLLAFCAPPSVAQQPAMSAKALTVERIYSMPSLNGRLTRGLAWTPDGKRLSYFETKGTGKEAKTELWVMDVANGERRLLVAADKLETILPADSSKPTQATGLGRRAPAQFQVCQARHQTRFPIPEFLTADFADERRYQIVKPQSV